MSARGPKSDKFWADAVRMAAFRVAENDPQKRKRINIIADNLVEAAINGDMAAIKEVGERIDGRAPQAIIHQGDEDAPVVIDSPRARLRALLDRSAQSG